jgi:hypothetical protein
MENKKQKVTKEWYEKIANSYLVSRNNPKPTYEEHVELKQEYLNRRNEK